MYVCLNTETSTADLAGRDLRHLSCIKFPPLLYYLLGLAFRIFQKFFPKEKGLLAGLPVEPIKEPSENLHFPVFR